MAKSRNVSGEEMFTEWQSVSPRDRGYIFASLAKELSNVRQNIDAISHLRENPDIRVRIDMLYELSRSLNTAMAMLEFAAKAPL